MRRLANNENGELLTSAVAGALWSSSAALVSIIGALNRAYDIKEVDHEGSYGTVGGVVVLLLWFYRSGIAILTGAELNAEIERASPYGKAPGQKNAQGRLLIGASAARTFLLRQLSVEPMPVKPSA